jgi:hypothetical protein
LESDRLSMGMRPRVSHARRKSKAGNRNSPPRSSAVLQPALPLRRSPPRERRDSGSSFGVPRLRGPLRVGLALAVPSVARRDAFRSAWIFFLCDCSNSAVQSPCPSSARALRSLGSSGALHLVRDSPTDAGESSKSDGGRALHSSKSDGGPREYPDFSTTRQNRLAAFPLKSFLQRILPMHPHGAATCRFCAFAHASGVDVAAGKRRDHETTGQLTTGPLHFGSVSFRFSESPIVRCPVVL